MKKLSELISNLSSSELSDFQDVPISGIACQPEELQNGILYCVIDEFLEYGHWIEGRNILGSMNLDAVSALLTEQPIPDVKMPQVIVPDARKAMAQMAKSFFDAPDEAMKIVGITGTNGKTTTAHLINQLLTACGEKSAALGTIGLFTGEKKHAETIYTTAMSPTFFETLAELRDVGISVLAAEISSHALKLDRVFGTDTDVAVFTNLTRDHLDFHETMDDYRDSKMKLFTRLKSGATAVVNRDNDMGKAIMSASPCPVLDYGCKSQGTLRAEAIQCSPRGTAFQMRYQGKSFDIRTSLVGNFNVYNILSAMATCLALGVEPEALQEASRSLHGVAGRIEPVPLPGDRVGIVDYAHTPDSLEKILNAMRDTGSERIITVFGCGGDRDRGKRPLMGEVAARLSDLCVVTSDNPRREDPEAIIRDILPGMPEKGVLVEPDRRKAIRKAFEISQKGDVILVAGKGDEPYQIIGDESFPFEDREELRCLS